MKTYRFTITIIGTGIDEKEAWQDAYETFALDPGECPDAKLIEETED